MYIAHMCYQYLKIDWKDTHQIVVIQERGVGWNMGNKGISNKSGKI